MGNIWTVDTSGNLTTDGGVSALGTMFAAAFDTNVAAAGVVLGGTSLVALGTDVNIDITITPKGSGSLIMSKVDIGAGAIDATTVGSVTPAAGAFTTLAATSLSLSGALTVTLLNLYDTDASNTLGIAWNENDTVNRVLNLYVSGANRALTITGDSTINQNVSTGGSPTFTGLTVSGLGVDGLVITAGGVISSVANNLDNIGDGATYGRVTLTSLDGANNVDTLVDAAVDNFTVSLGGANRLLTLGADVSLDQNLLIASSPEFAGLTLTALSGILIATAGVVSGGGDMDDIADGASYGRVLLTSLTTNEVTKLTEAATGDDFTVVLGGTNRALTINSSCSIGQDLLPTNSPSFAGLTITQAVSASGTPPTAVTVTGAAHTAITAATESLGMDFDFSASKTWAAGAGPLATQREINIQAPTYVGDAGTPLTITDAYTVYIDGAPTAGANMTITNPYALHVAAGAVKFGGALEIGGYITPSSRILGKQGGDVASANDITLGDGNYFDVTGAVEVQRILGTNWTAGSVITLQTDGAPSIKHGTAAGAGYYGFQLAGSGDFLASAGATLVLAFDGAWFREISRTVV